MTKRAPIRSPGYASTVPALALTLLLSGVSAYGHAEEGGHEAPGRFAVAMFLGTTRAEGENEATIGFEGGFRVTPHISIGAVIERAERERDTTLYIVGAGWHPLGSGLRLQLGAGQKDPNGEREGVVRAGLAWEFELGRSWFAKPYLAYDVIESSANETVFGVYLGRAFH